jgi:hypothetical protein
VTAASAVSQRSRSETADISEADGYGPHQWRHQYFEPSERAIGIVADVFILGRLEPIADPAAPSSVAAPKILGPVAVLDRSGMNDDAQRQLFSVYQCVDFANTTRRHRLLGQALSFN